jgi:threonyl-tRNA synthetase
MEKVPYAIIIGTKEAQNGTVTLRLRNGKNIDGLKPEELISTLKKEVNDCSIENIYK